MNLANLQWTNRCCADDTPSSQYAEAPMAGGGVVRLRTAPTLGGVLVSRFNPLERALDTDADGVPTYVLVSQDEAEALLA